MTGIAPPTALLFFKIMNGLFDISVVICLKVKVLWSYNWDVS